MLTVSDLSEFPDELLHFVFALHNALWCGVESVDPGKVGSNVQAFTVMKPPPRPSGLGDSNFRRKRPKNRILFAIKMLIYNR